MGQYLPWLAKQEERAILKGHFPALVPGEGTNLHDSQNPYTFKNQGCSPSLPTSTAKNLLTVVL